MHHELGVTSTHGNKKSQLVNDNENRFRRCNPACYWRNDRKRGQLNPVKKRIYVLQIHVTKYSQLHPSNTQRDRRYHYHRSVVEFSRPKDDTVFPCFCSVYLQNSRDIDLKTWFAHDESCQFISVMVEWTKETRFAHAICQLSIEWWEQERLVLDRSWTF
jgi:hypothetical protein